MLVGGGFRKGGQMTETLVGQNEDANKRTNKLRDVKITALQSKVAKGAGHHPDGAPSRRGWGYVTRYRTSSRLSSFV